MLSVESAFGSGMPSLLCLISSTLPLLVGSELLDLPWFFSGNETKRGEAMVSNGSITSKQIKQALHALMEGFVGSGEP